MKIEKIHINGSKTSISSDRGSWVTRTALPLSQLDAILAGGEARNGAHRYRLAWTEADQEAARSNGWELERLGDGLFVVVAVGADFASADVAFAHVQDVGDVAVGGAALPPYQELCSRALALCNGEREAADMAFLEVSGFPSLDIEVTAEDEEAAKTAWAELLHAMDPEGFLGVVNALLEARGVKAEISMAFFSQPDETACGGCGLVRGGLHVEPAYDPDA